MQSRSFSGKLRKKRKFLKAAAAAAVLVILFVILLLRIKARILPDVEKLAIYGAENAVAGMVNDALEKGFSEIGGYDKLVLVKNSEDGETLTADTSALNKLRSTVVKEVTRRLSDLEKNAVEIPIGTALGAELLSGIGGKVKFRIAQSGSVSTELTEAFFDAGINRVAYMLGMTVTVKVSVVIPGKELHREITVDNALARVVLSGKVPSVYIGK